MVLKLDKKDLITLVQGNEPSFELISKYEKSGLGSYNGSYGTWSWSSLKELTEEQLYSMHLEMKYQYK